MGETASDRQYKDITDFMFVLSISKFGLEEEDPKRFDEFRAAVVNAVKSPYGDNLPVLGEYLLGEVQYRRFFIVMQEELFHVLEAIPIEVTVPYAEHFTLITCYLLGKLSNMVADCHCFCGSKGRFVD